MTERAREKLSFHPETIAAAYGVAEDSVFGAVAPALYLTSTYAFDGLEQPGPYDYGRGGNPTRDLLAAVLAKLEGGAGAVVTASGMAAADLLFGRMEQHELIVAPHDCYGGVHRLLRARASRGHLHVKFVDQADCDALALAMELRPAMVFVETPSNPMMRVVDIAQVAHAAHLLGAKVVVDNTFLSPAAQNPIAFGADYVLHSTTKYLNGHSDVIGGAIVAANLQDAEDLRSWLNFTGAVGSPFDAWLTLRGARTLFVRMERQQQNAMRIASFLERHPAVRAVHYPGLASHRDHQLACRQQRGFGGMLSFELLGGKHEVRRLLDGLRVFTLAESLGGVESLIVHPATMTHADIGSEALATAGITEGLLRLSVGLENSDDLLKDLDRGLDQI